MIVRKEKHNFIKEVQISEKVIVKLDDHHSEAPNELMDLCNEHQCLPISHTKKSHHMPPDETAHHHH